MGWLARKHGLQTNSVTLSSVVTADGRLPRVDAEHEPDLFWALRGGNGNFGVVTAIEFEVYPVAELYAGGDVLPATSGPPRCWPPGPGSRRAARRDDDLDVAAALPRRPGRARAVRGQAVHGLPRRVPRHRGRGSRPLATACATWVRSMDTFAMVPPAALADMAMDPTEPLPADEHHRAGERPVPRALEDLLAAVGASSGSPLPLVQIRHLGGALARRTPRCRRPRDAAGELLRVRPWRRRRRAVGSAGRAPISGRSIGVLEPYRVGEYSELRRAAADASRFFGPETWARLRQVKGVYDPATCSAATTASRCPRRRRTRSSLSPERRPGADAGRDGADGLRGWPPKGRGRPRTRSA